MVRIGDAIGATVIASLGQAACFDGAAIATSAAIVEKDDTALLQMGRRARKAFGAAAPVDYDEVERPFAIASI